jgi:hypothetical protein
MDGKRIDRVLATRLPNANKISTEPTAVSRNQSIAE